MNALGEEVPVTARINHKLMPIERGERYEDPLNDALAEHKLGRTDGGGTMLLKSNEIEFIDVELFLLDLEKSIPLVVERLEASGAPIGSKLIIHEGELKREFPFGKREGFGVYFDGANLPKEVYETSDVNLVISELNTLIKGHGSIESYWEGPTETALYIYGDDAELMKKLIAPFMETYPLCKGARVVTIDPIAA
jgi:hypothetical protein